jgi:hypothetical protein
MFYFILKRTVSEYAEIWKPENEGLPSLQIVEDSQKTGEIKADVGEKNIENEEGQVKEEKEENEKENAEENEEEDQNPQLQNFVPRNPAVRSLAVLVTEEEMSKKFDDDHIVYFVFFFFLV